MPIVFVRAASAFHQPLGASAGSESVDASCAPRSLSEEHSDSEDRKASARSTGVRTCGASMKTVQNFSK